MVGRGSFHRHSTTSGGMTRTAARTVQLANELRFPAMPTMEIVEIQSMAMMRLIDTSCIFQVYAPALNRAVPQCTRRPRERSTWQASAVVPGIRRFPHRTESRRHSTRHMPCAQAHRQSPWRVSRSLCADLMCGDNHMLFIVGVVMVLIAVVIIPRMRVPGGVNSANLGWMSEQWLAEHRASHSL
jgi:hypothetical protein